MAPAPQLDFYAKRSSLDSAIWMDSQNHEVKLDVSTLPVSSIPNLNLYRRASLDGGIITASKDSSTPSRNDVSINAGEEREAPVFVTKSSGHLPTFAGLMGSTDTVHGRAGSISDSIVESVFSLGGNNDNDDRDNSREGTPASSLGAGGSRASLISLQKPKCKDGETWKSILSEVGLPFFIAGLGMVGAGLLLDYVMTWVVFQEIGELVILVTPLLGLKGNLEMTLAARLSTHANIGNLNKSTGNKWPICGGNLILDQLQAIVCGFVASMIAILIGYSFTGKFDPAHMSLLVVSSVLTASFVSLILGSTMISTILLSKKFKINPDNVATPVAGSLGDVVTLAMLSCFSSVIYRWYQQGHTWIPFVIIGFYLLCLPICFWFSFRNEFTRSVTITGWIPLILSVAISTGGGIILDIASNRFPGVALYQPVINGIGGNLVSVQASRISSFLHGHCEKRILPDEGRVCESPFSVFFKKGINSVSARLLLFLAVPGHIVFSTIAHFVATKDETIYGPLFLLMYVSAAVIQVSLLLYIAKILTNLCWRHGVDPDCATIPYLTALGDLFGSGLLFVAFELLHQMGQMPIATQL